MDKNLIHKEIENFDKIIKDMELKTKVNFINNIKIKENLKAIKRNENKNNILDELIFDKKSELNILKQLIILKEQKKLDFEDIISKYLYQLLLINKSTNNKIDKLKRNNLIINKKQKIINKLLENLNDEFYNYLDNENENIKNKKLKNYSLTNVFSNGVDQYLYKDPSSCKIKNNTYNLINEDDKKNNIELNNIKIKKGEIDDYIKDFQSYINKNKINSKNNNEKNQINNLNNIEKKNYNDNTIHINKNDINQINYNNNKNINIKNNEKYNTQQNKLNFKVNKNLRKSRDNLKYLMSQNEKEKLNKQKIKYYNDFIKLLFLKIRNYNINIIKNYFNKLKNYNSKLKLINIFNKILINKRYIIISKIKEIIQKSSLIYNEIINEEIINEDAFLNNIYLNQMKINEKKKCCLKDFKNNLNKMKSINKEMKDIKNKILKFAEKI